MSYNIIDSHVLEAFKSSLGSSLQSALKIADKESKEVSLTIKVNVKVNDEVEIKDEIVTKEFKEPIIDYKVTRTIKESKFDFSGDVKKVQLEYDEDGNVLLIGEEQLTMFGKD